MKIIANSSAKLIDVIHNQIGMNKTKIRNLLKYRRIELNGKIVERADESVIENDQITIDYENKQDSSSKKFPLPILFEDEYFIAVEKPAGIITSGKDVHQNVTLHELVSVYLMDKTKGKQNAFIIHRLDKEVSGIVLMSKAEKWQEVMKDNWQKCKKKYYAFVEGCPKPNAGKIETYLQDTQEQVGVVTNNKDEGKLAITHYKLLKKIGKNSLLEVELETGRKNQIRVHLSHIGCPIVGDRKYGADASVLRQIRLHAYSLEFPHPVTEKMIRVISQPPSNFTVVSNKNENYK